MIIIGPLIRVALYNAPRMAIQDSAAMLKRSVKAHQEGDLVAAEAGYRDVLASQPGNVDATHYMGMLCYQRGLLEKAMQLLGDAAAHGPTTPPSSPISASCCAPPAMTNTPNGF